MSNRGGNGSATLAPTTIVPSGHQLPETLARDEKKRYEGKE